MVAAVEQVMCHEEPRVPGGEVLARPGGRRAAQPQAAVVQLAGVRGHRHQAGRDWSSEPGDAPRLRRWSLSPARWAPGFPPARVKSGRACRAGRFAYSQGRTWRGSRRRPDASSALRWGSVPSWTTVVGPSLPRHGLVFRPPRCRQVCPERAARHHAPAMSSARDRVRALLGNRRGGRGPQACRRTSGDTSNWRSRFWIARLAGMR